MTGKEQITPKELNIVEILEDIKKSINDHILSGEYADAIQEEQLRFEALRRACLILDKFRMLDYHMDIILKPINFDDYRCGCGRCDGNYNKKRLEERIVKEMTSYFKKGIE